MSTSVSVERFELRPGYSISRVIKGGWQLAGGHGSFNRDEAVADMERFVEQGVTTFDCADIYTGVEEMIGDAIDLIRRRAGNTAANKVQVHTKLVPDLDALANLQAHDIESIIDRSLARLRIDQLHLVQFYWWDMSVGDPLAAWHTLLSLRDKGKILHLGCTNWDETQMSKFVDHAQEDTHDMVSAQVQYSLLDARPSGVFSQWCRSHQVKIFCYGVLAGGFLTPRWLGVDDPGFQFDNRSLIKYRLIIEDFGGWPLFQQLLEVLADIAAAAACTLSAVAMRYMLDQPEVAAVIIGARTASNLDSTLSVFNLVLSSEDRQRIDAVLAQRTGPLGSVYELERDRNGPHGKIMKYNLNAE